MLTPSPNSAAQYFVESYYAALNVHRNTISSFYMASAEMPGGKPLPSISFNGNQIPNAEVMQTMFEQKMPSRITKSSAMIAMLSIRITLPKEPKGGRPKLGKI